ncbi:hypothetical protein [Tepidimonas aquatica]|uniref:Uncharacterized protein n=1 Tax=Tepidimonas aquatica TaxID=247482 RepID=A0A554WP49_9BURK|nr:hypothetical protein [Tepidimonas aquatica]TSE25346.1 hypothetical protein Taqua_01090 [Tepidimonas aquatica]
MATHLAALVGPAWGMALLLATLLTLRGRGSSPRWRAWWRHVLWLALPGSAVLVAGLVLTAADGRIVTYAALVGVLGTVAAWRAGR